MAYTPPWRLFGLVSPREARLAFGLILLAITVIALIPGHVGGVNLLGWDKLNHIAAFAALALLARAGWPNARRTTVFIGLMVFGLAIELAQTLSFIHRAFSMYDWAADAIGICLGLIAAWLGAQILIRTPFLFRPAADE